MLDCSADHLYIGFVFGGAMVHPPRSGPHHLRRCPLPDPVGTGRGVYRSVDDRKPQALVCPLCQHGRKFPERHPDSRRGGEPFHRNGQHQHLCQLQLQRLSGAGQQPADHRLLPDAAPAPDPHIAGQASQAWSLPVSGLPDKRRRPAGIAGRLPHTLSFQRGGRHAAARRLPFL